MDSSEISPGFAFKTYLKKKIEDQICEHFHQHGGHKTHAKIADITFSYNNSTLIKMLKWRGNAIAYHQFDKLKPINTKIYEYCSQNKEKLCTPNAAFITFEEKDQAIAAVEAFRDSKTGFKF